ncbi:lasso RiPP family leader peptide-containing protein [Streptomyces sp. NPDC059063]
MEEHKGFDEQDTAAGYEPPALVAVGEFSEDTLGFGSRYNDVLGHQGWG